MANLADFVLTLVECDDAEIVGTCDAIRRGECGAFTKAKNSHDALVAALTRATDALELAHTGAEPSMAAIDHARAALKAAQEGQS